MQIYAKFCGQKMVHFSVCQFSFSFLLVSMANMHDQLVHEQNLL